MSWAWIEFQRCASLSKVKFDGGANWFFKNGKWKDSKLWGLKKGESANVYRAPEEVSNGA
jgi:hypothetical protein